PHGIVDSFQFGVSLNRIAHAVPESGELFIIPSGSSPVIPEELFPNPRWRRLSGGFREVGALLVLAARADAANLRELVDSTDGAIIVGDTVPADLPVAQSLAWLRPARSGPTAVAGTPTPTRSADAPLAVAARPRPVAPLARDTSRLFAGAAGIL